MSERKIPAPTVSPENKAYFDAATAGKLVLKFCTGEGMMRSAMAITPAP